MIEPLVILDPSDEQKPIGRHLAQRPPQLAGRLGIIDISKPRGDVFCDQIDHVLAERYPAIEVVRLRKPTFTRPAPSDLRREVAERCDAVIQALAD